METKVCTKCKKERPIEDFYWRDKAKGLRRSECKDCHNTYVKIKYAERQDKITQIKSLCKCQKCGEDRAYMLDFHHINPKEKEERIATFLAHNRKIEDIKNEIRKCVVLCANCHREFHFLEREEGLSLEDYLGVKEIKNDYPDEIFEDLKATTTPQIPKQQKFCMDCGKPITDKSTRCSTCAAKNRMTPLDEMSVTREELKQLIRTMPFTQIGEKYGVSDNAIRKWCDKFNLPRKAREIKAYSNEEWEKI